MTFSVDQYFWLFQSGPRQDALARAEVGEGRGKEFASSLFGVRLPEKLSADLAAGDSATLALASLSLPPASFPAEPLPVLPTVSGVDTEVALTPATPTPGAELMPAAPEASSAPGQPATSSASPSLSETVTLSPTAPAIETAPEMVAANPVTAAPSSDDADAGEAQTGEADAPDLLAAAATGTETRDAGETDTAEATNLESVEAAPVAPAPAALAAIAPIPLQTVVNKAGTEVRPSVALPVSGTGKLPQDASPAERTRAPATNSAAAALQPDLLADAATAETEITPLSVGAISLDDGGSNNLGAESGSTPSSQVSLFAGSNGQALPATAASPTVVTAQMTPSNAVLVATATQVPDIVARATSDGQDDRVVVQLDPPELGRISIDFKFDAQGLQHVTITAESPEAMRQLRQMHFELVQALERNGLSGQNMSFQHQNPQQNESWGQQAKLAGTRFDTPALTHSGLMIAADTSPHRQIASSGRLDIRL